ncbi:MAG TPA: hypothetical protein VIW29_01750 [Polyangiaceae bacterium]
MQHDLLAPSRRDPSSRALERRAIQIDQVHAREALGLQLVLLETR